MDIVSTIMYVLLLIICLILIGFLVKRYNKTRYSPMLFLIAFFILSIITLGTFIPLLLLPETEVELAKLLGDISTYPLLFLTPCFVLFLEGMKGRFNSFVTTIFITLSFVVTGYSVIVPSWSFQFNILLGRWQQFFFDEYLVLFSLVMVAFYVLVFFRLIQFMREKEVIRPKKMTIVAIIGLSLGALGTCLSFIFEISWLDVLSLLIGFLIIAIAYLKEPESFFLSNTKIEAIFLLNTESQILYVNLAGPKGTDATLAAAGVGGAITLVQEILDDPHPASQLIYKNRGFLFEHNFDHKVTAIMIVDQINPQLRGPLSYALSQFIEQYKTKLPGWDGKIDIFSNFEEELHRIFKFALGEKKPVVS